MFLGTSLETAAAEELSSRNPRELAAVADKLKQQITEVAPLLKGEKRRVGFAMEERKQPHDV